MAGIPIGVKAPEVVTAFIEMVPSDSVKVNVLVSKKQIHLRSMRSTNVWKYSNLTRSLIW